MSEIKKYLAGEYLKKIEGKIEYYVIKETGEAGLSQIGLATSCGIGETTIRDLITSIRGFKAPDSLKHWQGKDFSLAVVGNANVLIATFCWDVICHYSDKGREQAKRSERTMGRAGVTAFIYHKCGFSLQPQVKPKTTAEMFVLQAQVMLDFENRLNEQEQQLQNQKEQLKQQQKQLDDQQLQLEETVKPKVEKYEAYLETDGYYTIGSWAKQINYRGYGQNKMYCILRLMKCIEKGSTLPRGTYVKNGYFVTKDVYVGGFMQYKTTTYITPKGKDKLLQKVKRTIDDVILQFNNPKLAELTEIVLYDQYRPRS